MAISAQKVGRSEVSSKFVLALIGGMLAILCALALAVAALNGGAATRAAATQGRPATVSVSQGAGDHARSEKPATSRDSGSDSRYPQPTHGMLP